MLFHRVDSSYHHNLCLNLQKTRRMGFIINHLYFFIPSISLKMYSVGYFPPALDQNFASHSDNTKP